MFIGLHGQAGTCIPVASVSPIHVPPIQMHIYIICTHTWSGTAPQLVGLPHQLLWCKNVPLCFLSHSMDWTLHPPPKSVIMCQTCDKDYEWLRARDYCVAWIPSVIAWLTLFLCFVNKWAASLHAASFSVLYPVTSIPISFTVFTLVSILFSLCAQIHHNWIIQYNWWMGVHVQLIAIWFKFKIVDVVKWLLKVGAAWSSMWVSETWLSLDGSYNCLCLAQFLPTNISNCPVSNLPCKE